MNPYEVLRVRPDATPDEIKIAYRTIVKQYHPDVCKAPNASQIVALANQAYDQLRKKPVQPSPQPKPRRSAADAPMKFYEFVPNYTPKPIVIDAYGEEKIPKDSVVFLMWNDREYRIRLDRDYVVPFALNVREPPVVLKFE